MTNIEGAKVLQNNETPMILLVTNLSEVGRGSSILSINKNYSLMNA